MKTANLKLVPTSSSKAPTFNSVFAKWMGSSTDSELDQMQEKFSAHVGSIHTIEMVIMDAACQGKLHEFPQSLIQQLEAVSLLPVSSDEQSRVKAA
jgi:hypothetical protein